MWICLKLGFRPIHNSTGILERDLEGTKFNKYIALSRAYPQKSLGNARPPPGSNDEDKDGKKEANP